MPTLPSPICTRLLAIATLIFIALLLAVFDAAAAEPSDATEAHKYADGVLLPRLTAALNDWHYQHPVDPPARPWEHVHTTNAGDVARYRVIRDAFKDWNEAMKRAGY